MLLGVATCQTVAKGEFVTLYGLGNSLTNTFNPDRLTSLSSGPNGLEFVYHIRGNTSITQFLSTPLLPDDFVTSYGSYSQAFPSTTRKLDAIMLQPFYGSTVRQEVASAVQMVDLLRSSPLNADTRVLLYLTWPTLLPGVSYQDAWNAPVSSLDSPFVPSAAGHVLFVSEFLKSVPNAEFVPVGQIFSDLDHLALAGQVPGITTVRDFYGDAVHPMNNGSYVSALAVNSVTLGISPIGVLYPTEYLDPLWGTPLQAGALSIVQQTVRTNISIVPEPNSAVLCFVALSSITAFVRRRRTSV